MSLQTFAFTVDEHTARSCGRRREYNDISRTDATRASERRQGGRARALPLPSPALTVLRRASRARSSLLSGPHEGRATQYLQRWLQRTSAHLCAVPGRGTWRQPDAGGAHCCACLCSCFREISYSGESGQRTLLAFRLARAFAQHSDVTHPSGVHYCVIFQQRHLRREDDDILYSECWCMLDATRASSTAAAPASVCERCVASPLLTPGRGRGRLIRSSPGFCRATALRSDEWVVRCVAGARDCAAQRLAPAGRR